MFKPRFLDDYGYWDDFVKECFYETRVEGYSPALRPLKKKYEYHNVAWFKIMRHRYSWEWWKDFIGVEFTGAMVFMKDANGFQYLDHVMPLVNIRGDYAEGKMIHASCLEIMDEEIEN